MARGSEPASAKGPGLFPAATGRKKRVSEKTEESENNNRSGAGVSLYVRQQRASDIPACRSEVSSSGTSAPPRFILLTITQLAEV